MVVVHDVSCPRCSRIARELPVTVRSCRDPQLPVLYPSLGAAVRTCATALGMVRRDGSVRWWPGRTAVLGVLPVVRFPALPQAVGLLRTALRAAR